jgi:putative DNA primase/helicase
VITRPVALHVYVDGIPKALQRERRWVCWRYDWRDNRWTKVPYQTRGVLAKSDDPSTWCSSTDAITAYHTGRFDGIGFVLGDGWAGIDVDDCYPPALNTVVGLEILNRLSAACYVELSPGRTGVKAIGRSTRIGGQIDCATDPGTFTTWERPRYFTITGHGEGDPLGDLTPCIEDSFPPAPALDLPSTREGYTHAADIDDTLLWARMVVSDPAILKLYRGNTSAYGRDHSRADLALCCHLAWWTNYDAERIDRMFRQSDLYRPKWDHASYRRATIAKALARSPDPFHASLKVTF